MSLNATTYIQGTTPIHRLDARTKIVLMLAFSITLFLVESWSGLALCLAIIAICLSIAQLPLREACRQLIPIGIVLLITLVANSFVFGIDSAYSLESQVALAGIFKDAVPIPLVGEFCFTPAGFARGCFYVVRIALLVAASLLLTTTSTSTDIAAALESFLTPLQRMGLPTQDVVTIVSIALRFIPLSIDEFQMVKAAQMSRGSNFDSGGLNQRLRAWGRVMIPLFVGLYRRADDLALAMDARCYGMAKATHLNQNHMTKSGWAWLCAGLTACAALATVF